MGGESKHPNKGKQPENSAPTGVQRPVKLPACSRCRIRKTKCDGALPACSQCQKAGTHCWEDDPLASGGMVSRTYIWQLEKRLQEFEGKASLATPSSSHQHPTGASPQPSSLEQKDQAHTGDLIHPSWTPSAPPPQTLPNASAGSSHPYNSRDQPNQASHHSAVPSHTSPPAPSHSPSELSAHHHHPFKRRKTADSRLGPPSPIQRQISPDGEFSPQRSQSDHPFASSSSALTGGAHANSHCSEDDDEVVRLTDFQPGPGHDPLSHLVRAAFNETHDEGRQQEDHRSWNPAYARDPSPTLPTHDHRRSFVRGELSALKVLRGVLLEQVRTLSFSDRLEPGAYDRLVLEQIAARYFRYVNCPFPVLHEEVFALQLESVWCHAGRTREQQRASANTPIPSAHDRFQVLMVMASALASLTRNNHDGSELGRLSASLWQEARKLIPQTARKGWRKLQNTVMLMQYGLLVPSSDHVWRSCWEAMRLVVEMGLYAPGTSPTFRDRNDPLLLDVVRRLFWTTYSIDRMLSCTLGRASTLSDRWVMTDWPAVVEDAAITSQGIREDAPVCHLKVTNCYHFRLRKIQSDILDRLYVPRNENHIDESNATASRESWTHSVQVHLQQWLNDYKIATPFVTFHWVRLQFNLTMTMLLRPSPGRTHPSVTALQSALNSSGEVLSVYHQLHREAAINFGSIAMRNLFICGLTFLNSLQGLLAKNIAVGLSLADIAQQLQSCNVVLECLAASEASKEAERLRDAFEVLSRRVFRALTEEPAKLPKPSKGLTPASSVPSTVTSPSTNWPEAFANERDREHFYGHDLDNRPLPVAPKRPDPALYGGRARYDQQRPSSRSTTSEGSGVATVGASGAVGDAPMQTLLDSEVTDQPDYLQDFTASGIWPDGPPLLIGGEAPEAYDFSSDWVPSEAELMDQFGLGQLWNSTARAG